MAIGYFPPEENYIYPDWDEDAYFEDDFEQPLPLNRRGLDGLTVAAVIILLFLGLRLATDRIAGGPKEIGGGSIALPAPQQAGQSEESDAGRTESPAPVPIPSGPEQISYPYDNFTLTQGPHGASYGHYAIDIAAGKGVTVKSPISGQVTELYIDQWGNPTLVIENERYQVMLLHGNFTVKVGQPLKLGEPVGTEGNNGYTLDMQGNLCANRDCGYHTHLNVFDKQLGTNVNPLDVLQ